MKKVIWLITTAAFAAIGMLGIAAQGAVAYDPQTDCSDGEVGIKKQWINTSPNTEFANAEIAGGAVLCGTNTVGERAFTGGYINTPQLAPLTGPNRWGAKYRCANPAFGSACTSSIDLASGSFVSDAETDLAWFYQGNFINHVENLLSRFYVYQAPLSLYPYRPANESCEATYGGKPVIQCIQGVADVGFGNFAYSEMLITKEADGIGQGAGTAQYRMHILQPSILGSEAHLYLTKIGQRGLPWNGQSGEGDPTDDQAPIRICKYAGAVGATSCSTNTGRWNFVNGKRGVYVQCGAQVPGTLFQPTGWEIKAYKTPGWGMNPLECGNEKWTL